MSKIYYVYDSRGNEIEMGYEGLDGKLTRNKRNGTEKSKTRYDERGYQTQRIFYGEDDKLLIRNDGYAGWNAKYDQRGNQIEITWINDHLQPTNNTKPDIGVASILKTYDQRNNFIEEKKLGPDGNLMNGPDDWAHQVSNYDLATGELINQTRYTANGEVLSETTNKP